MTCQPDGPNSGRVQHRRQVDSTDSALHFCEGIRFKSALSSSARAIAIVLLPNPDGPRSNHAHDTGRLAKADKTFFCFSKPMNSEIAFGRYFSASGCGKPNAP